MEKTPLSRPAIHPQVPPLFPVLLSSLWRRSRHHVLLRCHVLLAILHLRTQYPRPVRQLCRMSPNHAIQAPRKPSHAPVSSPCHAILRLFADPPHANPVIRSPFL